MGMRAGGGGMGNLIGDVVRQSQQFQGRQERTLPEVAAEQPAETPSGFKGGDRRAPIRGVARQFQMAKEAAEQPAPDPRMGGMAGMIKQVIQKSGQAREAAGASTRQAMQQEMAQAQEQARQPVGPGSQWSPEQQEQWRSARGNPRMRNMLTEAHQQSQAVNSGRAPPRMSSMSQQQGYADQMRTQAPNPTGRRVGRGGGRYG